VNDLSFVGIATDLKEMTDQKKITKNIKNSQFNWLFFVA